MADPKPTMNDNRADRAEAKLLDIDRLTDEHHGSERALRQKINAVIGDEALDRLHEVERELAEARDDGRRLVTELNECVSDFRSLDRQTRRGFEETVGYRIDSINRLLAESSAAIDASRAEPTTYDRHTRTHEPEPTRRTLDDQWICGCDYMNVGPVCTKCYTPRPDPTDVFGRWGWEER